MAKEGNFMNIFRKFAVTGLAVGCFGVALPAVAEDEGSRFGSIEGNVTITNDYVYRGFTQSNEDFAIQGGLDWSHDSGAYFGVWASSIEFVDEALDGTKTTSSSVEIDLYGGVSGDFGNSIFTWDVGTIFYAYPDDPAGTEADFWEFGGTLGADLGMASVSIGAWWSPDFFGGIGDAWYFPLGIEVPIPVGNGPVSFSLSGNVGLSVFQLDDAVDVGDDNYVHWDLGLTVSIEDWFDVDLRYYDTDIGDATCQGVCDERFVVSVGRAF